MKFQLLICINNICRYDQGWIQYLHVFWKGEALFLAKRLPPLKKNFSNIGEYLMWLKLLPAPKHCSWSCLPGWCKRYGDRSSSMVNRICQRIVEFQHPT